MGRAGELFLPLAPSPSLPVATTPLLAAHARQAFNIHKEERIENVRSLLHRQSQHD